MQARELDRPARWYRALLDYRVPICAALMIVALTSTFLLGSQSASSFATYLLAIYVFAATGKWRALLLDRGLLLIAALLLYLALTSLWSTPWDARGAFGQAIRAVLVFAFLVSIAECMQVDWFRQRMTLAVATVGAAAAAAAIWVFFAEPPADARLNGLGQLDTHVAAGMVFAAAGLCALAWLWSADDHTGTVSKWSARASVVVLTVAVALTASRNAVTSGAFGAVCLLLSHRIAKPRRFIAWAGLSAAALGGALAAAYFLVPGADAAILPRGDSFRMEIWSYYMERIAADGPWFGLGVLTDDLTAVAGWPVQHPHNLYLAVAWEGGLFGLGLLLTVIATTLRTLFAHYAEAEAKLGLAIWALALPGYLVDGYELVDKIGWTWLLFWLPVAIALSLRGGSVLTDARRFGARHPYPPR